MKVPAGARVQRRHRAAAWRINGRSTRTSDARSVGSSCGRLAALNITGSKYGAGTVAAAGARRCWLAVGMAIVAARRGRNPFARN